MTSEMRYLKQRNYFPLSVITRKHKAIFSIKNYSPKTYEVNKATQSSLAVFNMTNFFKSCVTTDKGHNTERP